VAKGFWVSQVFVSLVEYNNIASKLFVNLVTKKVCKPTPFHPCGKRALLNNSYVTSLQRSFVSQLLVKLVENSFFNVVAKEFC
jgi:hypothetical protein